MNWADDVLEYSQPVWIWLLVGLAAAVARGLWQWRRDRQRVLRARALLIERDHEEALLYEAARQKYVIGRGHLLTWGGVTQHRKPAPESEPHTPTLECRDCGLIQQAAPWDDCLLCAGHRWKDPATKGAA